MHSFSIPGPYDMALRIALALISSAAIGFDRGVHGHIAGLRTTMLVGLAAAVAMVLADTFLGVDGKTASSFSTLDPMRLPLGVLTGVGFIGGGAILRRGDLITGVTTAATLWMVTVIGLCFGAGQIGLGLGSALTALLTLRAMKWVEVKIPRDCRAMLEIAADLPPSVDEVAALLGSSYEARFRKLNRGESGTVTLEVTWKQSRKADAPEIVRLMDQRYRVVCFEIIPDGEH